MMSMNLAASSMRRLISSLVSSVPLFEVTRPRTIILSLGTKRNGSTPPAWRERYNLMKGATHGLAHILTQLAYFRPANRHARYRNLYFVGAST